jgi:hypothetical protein
MSRGLGEIQQTIKFALAVLMHHGLPTRFEDVAAWLIAACDGKEGDRLEPSLERSLRRGLKGLVDSGDVLVIAGTGSPKSPYRYMTVETLAHIATGRKVRGRAHAKQVVGGMLEEMTRASRG